MESRSVDALEVSRIVPALTVNEDATFLRVPEGCESATSGSRTEQPLGPARREQHGSRAQRLLQIAACFVILWIVQGTEWAEGIAYARLILPPCDLVAVGIWSNASAASGLTSGPDVEVHRSRPSAAPCAETGAVVCNGTLGCNACETDAMANITMTTVSGGRECGGFGRGASQTAWVSSIASGMRLSSGIFGSAFLAAFGVRKTVIGASLTFGIGLLASTFSNQLYQVYLSRSVVSGFGAGLLFTIPVHCLAVSQEKYFALASALVFSGVGFGCIFNGYVGRAVVYLGDWRWYYRMIACLSLTGVVAAFFMDIEPSESTANLTRTTHDGRVKRSSLAKVCGSCRKLFDAFRQAKELYRTADFIILILVFNFFSLGWTIPIVTASHRAKELGVEDREIYLQISYLGYGCVAGCLVFAVMLVCVPCRNTLLLAVILLIMGLSTALSTLVSSKSGLIVYSIVYAGLAVSSGACAGPVVREVVTAKMTSTAFAHLCLWSTVAVVMGPPLAGYVFDRTQSYDQPFIFGGLILVLAASLQFVVDVRVWRSRKRLRHAGTSAKNGCQQQSPVLHRPLVLYTSV